jgi:hypothetical protein
VTRQLSIDTRVIGIDEILDGEVDYTAFNFPEDLTCDQWVEYGRRIYRFVNATMWLLGEWWRYGEHRADIGLYSEDRVYQAAPLGYRSETLTRAAKVCERIPPEERDPRLSFGHFATLSRVREGRTRVRLRDQAIREEWTVRDTEAAVTRANAAGRRPGDVIDVVHAPVCKACRKPWPCAYANKPAAEAGLLSDSPIQKRGDRSRS